MPISRSKLFLQSRSITINPSNYCTVLYCTDTVKDLQLSPRVGLNSATDMQFYRQCMHASNLTSLFLRLWNLFSGWNLPFVYFFQCRKKVTRAFIALHAIPEIQVFSSKLHFSHCNDVTRRPRTSFLVFSWQEWSIRSEWSFQEK